ncbi:gfo/Idh/MocA family oxidoreductase [candidate division WOR-3 bacterium]|uniref:Gfo/Idh/MocA family oxidoreductase n=1 Tax=candidate division WOR-3 bacterium TaxID=2052148 RepID=A0A9D5K909_UNCW3|nr:gfo/Idh/MocA family oxidoreductase [candidate division WOR-3 bacterium]MBD3363621.1 gfo/Idh/MocA family oxidoreductase [candidate division WOR-3 bacterium]
MVRLGVVGAGYWGPNLIRNFARIEDVKIEQIADSNKDALAKLQDTYADTVFTQNPEELFASNVDAVCIATNAETHFQLSKQALLAGKHTFCEKPMTLKTSEAEELVEIAREKGLVLMVGHVMVYHPAIRRIKGILDSGEIGDLLYINSIRVNLGLARAYENVLWSLTPHDLSIFLYLFEGEHPVGVSATGKDFLTPGVEDIVFLSLFFNQENLAHVRASWLDPVKTRKLIVVGTKGIIVFNDTGADSVIKIYDKWIKPKGDGTFEHNRNDEFKVYDIPKDEPLFLECQDFIKSIVNGKRPITDGESGATVISILEHAQESMKQKGTYLAL